MRSMNNGGQNRSGAGVTRLLPRYPIEGINYRSPEYAQSQLDHGNWVGMSIGDSLRATAKANPRQDCGDRSRADRSHLLNSMREPNRVAASLLELGLKPADRALFQLGTSIDFFIAFYGCMKAGVIPVCTLPQYRLAEMRHFAEVTSAKAIVRPGRPQPARRTHRSRLELRRRFPALQHVIVVRGERAGTAVADAVWPRVRPDAARAQTASVAPSVLDVAVFQLSGGSTNLPKIIPRMHGEYLGATLPARATIPTHRGATSRYGACRSSTTPARFS